MENTPNDKVENSPEVQNPSRRRLLKFLAVGGAVTAVSLLPGKWSSPSIKTGVLPAHAQVTPTPTPIPDVYEVACSDEFSVVPDEVGAIYRLSATAMNITTNQPLVGVLLKVVLSVDNVIINGTSLTDANGIASWALNAAYADQTAAVATVSFDDPATYGTDSCEIVFPWEAPN
jgi:hypothetical protein